MISHILSICKEYDTAVRIGTNHGFLSPRILQKYGNTAKGMVHATLEYLKICENLGFYNTIISLKSSNINVLVDAYSRMVEEFIKHNAC